MVLARALSARPVTPDVTMNPRMKTINPVTVKKSASVTVRTAPYPPSMGMPRSGIGASIFGKNFGIIGVCREAIRSRKAFVGLVIVQCSQSEPSPSIKIRSASHTSSIVTSEIRDLSSEESAWFSANSSSTISQSSCPVPSENWNVWSYSQL